MLIVILISEIILASLPYAPGIRVSIFVLSKRAKTGDEPPVDGRRRLDARGHLRPGAGAARPRRQHAPLRRRDGARVQARLHPLFDGHRLLRRRRLHLRPAAIRLVPRRAGRRRHALLFIRPVEVLQVHLPALLE